VTTVSDKVVRFNWPQNTACYAFVQRIVNYSECNLLFANTDIGLVPHRKHCLVEIPSLSRSSDLGLVSVSSLMPWRLSQPWDEYLNTTQYYSNATCDVWLLDFHRCKFIETQHISYKYKNMA